VGIADALQMNIEAYKRINEALLLYLSELEKIDIAMFKKETEEYNKAIAVFASATSLKELNVMLLETFDRMGFSRPWEGNFNDHMALKLSFRT